MDALVVFWAAAIATLGVAFGITLIAILAVLILGLIEAVGRVADAAHLGDDD